MRNMKKWLLVAISIPILMIGIMAGVGALLPVSHTASVDRVVRESPEAVWSVITDVEAFPSWRPDVDEVRVEDGGDGLVAWVESGGSGVLPMETVRREPPRILITRIGEGLPFGGRWTYRLDPVDRDRTRVTLTEEGEVYNPVFRFVSRFVMGHESTMDAYLDALEARMAGTSAEG